MEHVNAPSFPSTCCAFHNTVLYTSFALGRLLSGTCESEWMPTGAKACVDCGLLVSENGACFCCSIPTSGERKHFGSNHFPTTVASEESLISRGHFTRFCAHILRHLGTTDLEVGIEMLLGAAVDMSSQSEWQQFWETHPPFHDWVCLQCCAKNDKDIYECVICGQLRPWEYAFDGDTTDSE